MGESERSGAGRTVRTLTVAAWGFMVVHAVVIALAFVGVWVLPIPLFAALLLAGPLLTAAALVAALIARDRVYLLVNVVAGACYVVVWALLSYLLMWSVP